jgi:hypothetical protein
MLLNKLKEKWIWKKELSNNFLLNKETWEKINPIKELDNILSDNSIKDLNKVIKRLWFFEKTIEI